MEIDRGWQRVTWGITLILLGCGIFLERLGVLPSWARHYHWWGVLVMALGLLRLMRPRLAASVGNGVAFTLLGAWLLLASNQWHGLTWANSWPLALVAVGAGTVARAVASRWLPDLRWISREGRHEAS